MRGELVIEAVFAELRRAESLWPCWPDDLVYGASIVAEEAGELVKAVNDLAISKKFDASLGHVHKEAVQTAAMALRFLLNLPEGGNE